MLIRNRRRAARKDNLFSSAFSDHLHLQNKLEFPHVRFQALRHEVAYNFSRGCTNKTKLAKVTSSIKIRSSTNPRTRLSSTTKTLRPSNSHSMGDSFRRTLFFRNPWLGTRYAVSYLLNHKAEKRDLINTYE